MMEELGKIQKIVEAGGDMEETENLGESIPELITFQAEVREDDHELDSNPSTRFLKETEPQPEQIDLSCLETHAELQMLRMKL